MTDKTDMTVVDNVQALAEFDDEMSKLLQEHSQATIDVETFSIPFISIRNSKFALNDEKIPQPLKVVVLAAIFENTYYDATWDPDVVSPPACFAMSDTGEDMEPHEISPNKQSDTCDYCPLNQFGTATVGKGKACKNRRRLLLASYDDNGVDLDNLAMLSIPPASIRGWSAYAKSVAMRMKRPTFALVTSIGFDEDADYPKLTFAYDSPISDPNKIKEIVSRLEEFKEMVSMPYNVEGYEPPVQAAPAPAQPSTGTKKSKMS